MSKKWIVQLPGGWKQRTKAYKEFDIKLQNTKVFHWWDYSKNTKRPEDFTPQSNSTAWFKCDVGHSFNSKISHVFGATHKASGGCQKCGGRIKFLKNGNDIENKFPKISKFWSKEKNLGLPKDYPPDSNYKAWWYCSTCNTQFQKGIGLITSSENVNCSKCTAITNLANLIKISDKYPKIIKEIWDFKKNKISPNEVRINSDKLYWWKCLIHGSTKATITRAKNNSFCEKCVSVSKTSEIEIRIYFELKTVFKDIINQKIIKKRQLDFFLPEENIAIEFDGYPWHLKKEQKDFAKDKIIKNEDIKIFRIRDERLVNDLFPDAILIKSSEYGNPIKIIVKLLSKLKTLIKDKDKIDKINKYIKNNKIINDNEYNIIRAKFSLADTDRSLSKLKNICKYFAYERNFPLTPEHFTSGSWQRVWWTCDKGHSTKLQICQFRQYYYDEKLDKFNCTKCRGSRQSSNPATRDVRAGVLFNYPDIYHQYNRDKNGKKFRSDVSVNSSKFLWWICSKGHSWQACVIERTIGDIKHCPKCDPNSWKRKAKKNVNVKKGLQDKINRGQKIIYKPWSEK
jgi:very-short-patch-repair endonuclease